MTSLKNKIKIYFIFIKINVFINVLQKNYKCFIKKFLWNVNTLKISLRDPQLHGLGVNCPEIDL